MHTAPLKFRWKGDFQKEKNLEHTEIWDRKYLLRPRLMVKMIFRDDG